MGVMIDDVFAVIADSTRRQILQALTVGPRPVGELVNELGISQPTVSKHLKVLRNVDLVTSKAAGQKRFYSLNAEPLSAVQEWITSLQESQAELAASSPEDHLPQPTLLDLPQEKETAGDKTPGEKAAPQAPAVQEAEETSPGQEVEENGAPDILFNTGQEGGEENLVRQAHQASSFTPMETFTPQFDSEQAPADASAIDLASLPVVDQDTPQTLDLVILEEEAPTEGKTTEDAAVEEAAEETEAQQEVPEGYVLYTGEDQESDFLPEEEEPSETEKEQEGEDSPETEAEEGQVEAGDKPVQKTAEEQAHEAAPEAEPAQEKDPEEDAGQEEPGISETFAALIEEAAAQAAAEEEGQASSKTDTEEILEIRAQQAPPESETYQAEQRGFLASLTRWGRRRSR